MPRIIAFEGIDGSGKTLQVGLLNEALVARGFSVRVISFPVYESFFGRECGTILSGSGPVRADELDPKSMSLWYALDRWKAFSALGCCDTDFLLLNRFTLSNAVYQSIRAPEAYKQQMVDWVLELEHGQLGLPVPDLYIILDLDPVLAQSNVLSKGHRDYVGNRRDVYEESGSILSLARQQYLALAAALGNTAVVDCLDKNGQMRDPANIQRDIIHVLKHKGLI